MAAAVDNLTNEELLRYSATDLNITQKQRRYILMQELYKKAAQSSTANKVYKQLQSLSGLNKLVKLRELAETPEEPLFKRKSTHSRTLRRTNSISSMVGLSDKVKALLMSMAFLDGLEPVMKFRDAQELKPLNASSEPATKKGKYYGGSRRHNKTQRKHRTRHNKKQRKQRKHRRTRKY